MSIIYFILLKISPIDILTVRIYKIYRAEKKIRGSLENRTTQVILASILMGM